MIPEIGDVWKHTSTNFEVIYYIIYEVEKEEVVNNKVGYNCLVQMYNGLYSYITKIWLSPSNGLWEKMT